MIGRLVQGERIISGRRREQLLFLMDNGIYVVTVVLFFIFVFMAPFFFTQRNLVNILISASLAGIVTAGYTVAILAGQIDTSTQGVLAVATVTTALLFEEAGFSLPLTVIFALAAGIAAGLFNGLIVVNGKNRRLCGDIGDPGRYDCGRTISQRGPDNNDRTRGAAGSRIHTRIRHSLIGLDHVFCATLSAGSC